MAQALELNCPKCQQLLTCEVGAFSREIVCLRCEHRFRPGDVVDRDRPLPAIVAEPEDAERPVEAGPAVEAPPDEAASDEAAPDEADPPPLRVGKGGTLLLDESPEATEEDPGAVQRDDVRAVAAAIVADVGKRLPGRSGPIVTVAVPGLTVVAFTLLIWAEGSVLRALLGIVGSVGLAVVVVIATSVVLSKRHAAPSGSAKATFTTLSPSGRVWVAVGLAALVVLSCGVGVLTMNVTAPSASASDGAPAIMEARAGIAIPVPEVRAVAVASAISGAPRVNRDLVIAEGMVLHVPDNLRIDEGFDLLIHFAGRTKLVEDSVATAGLNAAVVVANLGEGSGPYMEKFGGPDSFRKLVGTVEERIVERGMPPGSKVRRVAVSSFGAGYGAVLKLVSQPSTLERIDAVLVMEGLYTSYVDPREREVDRQRIAPYVELAKMAKDGDKLFVITHSNVMSDEFATAKAVSDAILDAVEVGREPASDSPQRLELRSAKSLFAGDRVFLEAESKARIGSFVVRGYGGKTAGHHVAHLAQMSVTVLPLLMDRWSQPEKR